MKIGDEIAAGQLGRSAAGKAIIGEVGGEIMAGVLAESEAEIAGTGRVQLFGETLDIEGVDALGPVFRGEGWVGQEVDEYTEPGVAKPGGAMGVLFCAQQQREEQRYE
jgi:hypothetical protein